MADTFPLKYRVTNYASITNISCADSHSIKYAHPERPSLYSGTEHIQLRKPLEQCKTV